MMDDQSGLGGHSSGEDDLIEIDLNFESMRRFQAEFSPNLSKDGLFIDTGEPLSPGSVVRFRVILPEEFIFLEGTAVVEWVRSAEAASEGAPGMALRFVTLSPQNQELVEQLVQDHIDAGGSAFDFDAPHATVDFPTDALEGAPAPTTESLDEGYRLTLRRSGPNIEAETLQALSDATNGDDTEDADAVADDHVQTPEEAQGFAILSKTSVPLVEQELQKTTGEEPEEIDGVDFAIEATSDEVEVASAEVVVDEAPEVEEAAAFEPVVEEKVEVEEIAEPEPEPEDEVAVAFEPAVDAVVEKEEVVAAEPAVEAEFEVEPAAVAEVVGEAPALDWSDEGEPAAQPEQQPLDLALDRAHAAEAMAIEGSEAGEDVSSADGDLAELTTFDGGETADAVEVDGGDAAEEAAVDLAVDIGDDRDVDEELSLDRSFDIVEETPDEAEPASSPEPEEYPTPAEFDSGPEVIDDVGGGELGGPAFDVSLPEPDDEPDTTPVIPDEGLVDVTVHTDDYEDEEPPRRRRRWPLGLAAVVILALAAGFLWPRINAWNQSRGSEEPQEVVIAAVEETAEPQDAAPETGSDALMSEGPEPSAEVTVETPEVETGAADESVAEAEASPVVVAEPEPEPEPTNPPPAVELAKATAVTSIEVDPGPRGTVIRIRGNGSLEDGAMSMEPLSSPPRVLVRIRGIQSQFRPYTIESLTPEVTTVRSGLHEERRPSELWVVVDLTGADVVLDGVDIRRDAAELILARR